MKILLIDDHPVFRDGLKVLCEKSFPDAIVQERGEIDIDGVPQGSDLLVLDLMVPGFDPWVDLSRLRNRLSRTVILAMSMTDDLDLIDAVMSAGANGFIHKSAEPKHVIAGMRQVMEGDVIRLLPDAGLSKRTKEFGHTLIPRQVDVLALISQGLSNKEIARRLEISHHTVRLHVSSMLSEIGATSRSAAAAMARDLLPAERLKQR